jgi:tRNA (guanosine-2'-O-)-methyltransferase
MRYALAGTAQPDLFRAGRRSARRSGDPSSDARGICAPLWPMHGANLGTLLRTCDAVGACLAVPRLPWVPEALARGNTL